ncbi:MAG: DUF4157 domain-containing protein [Sphingobacteriaceae bacterium]|nr:MAG: DUF4157 domain-containing protein [Sphingobacteriaceae bacterium]
MPTQTTIAKVAVQAKADTQKNAVPEQANEKENQHNKKNSPASGKLYKPLAARPAAVPPSDSIKPAFGFNQVPLFDQSLSAMLPLKSSLAEDKFEREANSVARRIIHPANNNQSLINKKPHNAARGLSAGVRHYFEKALGWSFTNVVLHTGKAAAAACKKIGAWAYTKGKEIFFGDRIADPESPAALPLLAHELAHVLQQDKGRGENNQLQAGPGQMHSGLSASPTVVQAAPRVTNVAASAAELGVGGRDIRATATIAGAGRANLTWTVNPGGAAPVGVSMIGSGRTVRVRAAQPPPGTVVGGTPLTLRAEVTGVPADFADSTPVNLVQVVSSAYTAAPALTNVPSLIPGAFPPNTGEPNRDGIAGNTVTVNAVTAPAGRPVTVTFRRALGASLAGNVITPGSTTGDVRLRITDTATNARLNETQPSLLGPAALMAEMTINAVPTRVASLTAPTPGGPYGVRNTINFRASDTVHPPLTRIVGELITGVRDDFLIGPPNTTPPNTGFNPAFSLTLAVPANNWHDQVITGAGALNTADLLPAIDINRFVGPGVPRLPRRLIFRQRFVYSSWQGGGTVVSNVLADGQHIRSLIGPDNAPRFHTEHRFGAVASVPRTEPYVGNPLIRLTNVTAVPTAASATGIAADSAATANVGVTSSVVGRTVNWTVLSGDISFTAGNPAALPATATLTAGARTGTFRVRASDSVFPNRRVDGTVRIRPVNLAGMRAAPNRVPAGTLSTNVSVNANPGGRTLTWTVDPAAIAGGVTVAPVSTGPGRVMNVTVTRPAAFTGTVRVTATDSVLAARTASTSIRFL